MNSRTAQKLNRSLGSWQISCLQPYAYAFVPAMMANDGCFIVAMVNFNNVLHSEAAGFDDMRL